MRISPSPFNAAEVKLETAPATSQSISAEEDAKFDPIPVYEGSPSWVYIGAAGVGTSLVTAVLLVMLHVRWRHSEANCIGTCILHSLHAYDSTISVYTVTASSRLCGRRLYCIGLYHSPTLALLTH